MPVAAMVNATFVAGKQTLVFTGCVVMTTGVLTVSVAQVDVTDPQGLVTITWYAVPLIAAVTALTISVDEVAPGMFVNVPAQEDADCHW